MILTQSKMTELWIAASQAEFGLRLLMADPKDVNKIINALYEVRKGLGARFDAISICRPNGGEELWMVKQSVAMEETDDA